MNTEPMRTSQMHQTTASRAGQQQTGRQALSCMRIPLQHAPVIWDGSASCKCIS